MADIYIHYGTDGDKMAYALMERAGVEQMLKPGMKVVLKPNLVVARPASEGATTHPEIVEGVIRFLHDHGIHDITVAEGAWAGDNTLSAFQRCGYRDLEQRYGVRLVDTKKDPVVSVSSQGFAVKVCKTPLEADFLINLPVLKSHCQTDVTCCLKNLKGCIPDSEKRRFHSSGLHKPIAALSAAIRPHLHIVDSICGDLTFEEGGNPVESNRVMLGFDPVLLDSYGAGLIGYAPEEVEHLCLAQEYGVGQFWSDNCTVEELGVEDRPKTMPVRSRIAEELSRYADESSACSVCYAALMFALHKRGTHGLEINSIKIGQGYRGQHPDGLGVGNCAKGCPMYVPGCPPTAIDIIEMLDKSCE